MERMVGEECRLKIQGVQVNVSLDPNAEVALSAGLEAKHELRQTIKYRHKLTTAIESIITQTKQ